MDKLFIAILNNTLVASWIIFAVIVLRFVFKKFIKNIPKWVNCILWGLVAIRLVFPFSIESIFSLIPNAKPVPVDIEYAKIPQINSGINVVNTAINPVLENNFVAKEIASVNPIQIVIIVASYIWVIGAIGILIYALASFFMLKRGVKSAKLVEKDIFRCETIDSPFILGILRPRIYIPDFLDEEAYMCVTEHEKAHIKRGDFIWKPLGFLILSVYWFNPLCWIAYICLCKDIEYACDEKVTRDKDKDWKAKYCQVLLDCSSQRRLVSACPVAFGEVSVKDRIKSVINYKEPSFWILCVSIIACAVVGVLFMTNPKNNTNITYADNPSSLDYNQPDDEISVSSSVDSLRTELGDLNGDGQSDYIEYTGMDGYYNHLALYLTEEGAIYEDEFEGAIGENDAVRAVDLDRDGVDELLITISTHANTSVDYAVLKKGAAGWKRLDESKSDDESMFFPMHFTHDQKYIVNITCDGLERQTSFDMEYLWRYWKNVGGTDTNSSEQILDNYDEIYKSPKGTQVGELMGSGIRNVGLLKYDGYPCLVAEYGVGGRNQDDFWGNAYFLFDYDLNGKIRILDFGFDAAKVELPETKYHRISEIPKEAILCEKRLLIRELGKVNVVIVLPEAGHRTNQLVTYLASDDEIIYTLNDCDQDLECTRMACPCLYDVDKDGKEELVIYTRYYFGAGPDAIEERDFILTYKIDGYNVTPFSTDMYDYELMNEIKKACNLPADVTVSETNELVPVKIDEKLGVENL